MVKPRRKSQAQINHHNVHFYLTKHCNCRDEVCLVR